jgi:integrase/recombinase XerC
MQGMYLHGLRQMGSNPGDDWLAEFAALLVSAGLAPRTILAYCQGAGLFLKWFAETKGENSRFTDLKTADVLNYHKHLVSDAHLRSSTINLRLLAIRYFCGWAERQGFLKSNPAATVKSLPIVKRRPTTGLTEPEVRRLLQVAGESKQGCVKRNYGLLQLFLQTGLRVGEVTSLKVGDVRIERRSGEVQVRQGNGNKEREVPLNADARRALGAYLQLRPQAQPSDPLFLNDRNRALSPRAVQRLLQRLARRAEITRLHVTPYVLRHTFALNYLRQNPDKKVQLANLLGYEKLDTTAIYTQPSGEELADAPTAS